MYASDVRCLGTIAALALTITSVGPTALAQQPEHETPPPSEASPEPAPTADDEDGETTGETAGLVLIVVGAVGVVTGASLMIAGAVAQDEPEDGLSQEEIAAAASGAQQQEEEADDTHVLTSIGAVTFVGSAVLMAVGGWIRFDWSDDESDVAITPYVTPRGAGVVASF